MALLAKSLRKDCRGGPVTWKWLQCRRGLVHAAATSEDGKTISMTMSMSFPKEIPRKGPGNLFLLTTSRRVCTDRYLMYDVRLFCILYSIYVYTQYELYGTGYMGHFFGLVENSEKIRDVTSL